MKVATRWIPRLDITAMICGVLMSTTVLVAHAAGKSTRALTPQVNHGPSSAGVQRPIAPSAISSVPRAKADIGAMNSIESAEPPVTTLVGPGSSLVSAKRKLGNLSSDPGLALANGDLFGSGVARIGDVDGDGVVDVAVGARGTVGALPADVAAGAVWVLLMNANGTVKSSHKISAAAAPMSTLLGQDDNFGRSVAGIGDVNADGVPDLAVGAPNDDDHDADNNGIDDGDGINLGAIYIVLLNSSGNAIGVHKISDTDPGLVIANNSNQFGFSIAPLGDLDGAGGSTFALAVGEKSNRDGGAGHGAVEVLFMHYAGGTSFPIDAVQKISDTVGTPGSFTLQTLDLFGSSVSSADVNGDAIPDLAVSAVFDDDGGPVGTNRGAVYIMNLARNGTVTSFQKITGTQGGFTGVLDDADFLGDAVEWVPDLDGNGVPDLMVGATGDDDGFSAAGAVWVMLMNSNGTVKRKMKISETVSPLSTLGIDDNFGASIANLGDVNGDGLPDLMVGTPGDDDGAASAGALYRVLLGRTATALTMPTTYCNNNLVITVTVTPTTATGNVELFEGATSLGVHALASGQTAYTLPPRAVGSYPGFTARYYGDDNDLESTSPAFSAVVSLIPMTASVVSNHNPRQVGLDVTFTATIANGVANPLPATGTVEFFDGATSLGSSPLSGGTASFGPTTSLTVGDHPITAVYSGDDCHATKTSNILTQTITKIPTTTSLASDLNPANDGDEIHLTATVGPAGTGGDVEFFDGAASLGTATLSAGSAVLAISTLSTGTHSLTAKYLGDPTHEISTSTPVSQKVREIPEIVLEQTPVPAHCTDDLTFTVTMTPSSATGTVELFEGAASLGVQTLVAGEATFTLAPRTVGTYSGFTAVYSGDADYAPRTSSPLEVVVSVQGTATIVVSSQNPQVIGQLVTFTATVTPGIPAPGLARAAAPIRTAGADVDGSVEFYDNVTLLGTATLSGSVASFDISSLALGDHPIKAVYLGSSCYSGSESGILTQQITRPPTTTSLASDRNPSNDGDLVNLTATVGPAGTGGTVEFFDGVASLGTVPLSAGLAVLSTSTLSVGTHSLTAKYLGDATHEISTSVPLSQVVKALAGVVLTQSPVTAYCNDAITLIAAVTPSSATGSVELFEGATSLGTLPLGTGQASFALGTRAVGTYSGFTVVYSGDASNAGSTSSPLAVVVSYIPTSTVLTPTPNPQLEGQTVTLSATVSNSLANPSVPTGSVEFFDGAASLGTVALTAGTATTGPMTFTLGDHPLTAVFSGDACHATQTSDIVTQRITRIPTTTSLQSDTNPSTAGGLINLYATVGPAGAGGMVEFFDGATSLGTAALFAGLAGLPISTLSAGTHSLTAKYLGDATHEISTSDPVSQVVRVVTTVAIAQSPDPAHCGDNLVLTVTVTPTDATGEVELFAAPLTLIGTQTLAGGQAQFLIGAAPVGTRIYGVNYLGDATHAPGTFAPFSAEVSLAPISTSLTSSQNPQVTGLPVTFTANVSPADAPGTVEFFDGATSLGTQPLAAGSAQFTTSTLATSTHSITAVYSGSPCFAASTSSPLSQVISPNLGPNLCMNGDFHDGLRGWSGYEGSLALATSGRTSAPAGKLTGTSRSSEEFGLNDSPSCVANAGAAGRRYRVSAWVRSDAGRGAMRIRIREYNGGSSRQSLYSPAKTLTAAWQELVVEIVTLRANSSLDLQVLDQPTVAREMFLVDDIAIQLVPAGDRPPVVIAPATVTVTVGTTLNVDVTASDADGPPIGSLSASPFAATNPQTFTATNANTKGRLTWIPTLAEAGNTYTVTFTASNVLSGTATTAITVVAPPPPSSNLCGNGTFDVDLAGWIPYENAVLTMVGGGRSGSALQARTSSNSTFGIDDKPNWIGTVVGRGAVYRFTAWVKSAAHHGSARIRLYEYVGSTQQGSTAYSNIVTLSTSWQKLTLDYVVRTAGSTLSMRVTDTPAASSGETFLVDDVSIVLVTPPVALAQQPVAPDESVALEYARPVAYPNPARGVATLGLSLAKAGALRVELYDVSGRVVRVLADEAQARAGTHRFVLERERGAKLGAGIYFYRADVAGTVHRGRIVVLE